MGTTVRTLSLVQMFGPNPYGAGVPNPYAGTVETFLKMHVDYPGHRLHTVIFSIRCWPRQTRRAENNGGTAVNITVGSLTKLYAYFGIGIMIGGPFGTTQPTSFQVAYGDWTAPLSTHSMTTFDGVYNNAGTSGFSFAVPGSMSPARLFEFENDTYLNATLSQSGNAATSDNQTQNRKLMYAGSQLWNAPDYLAYPQVHYDAYWDTIFTGSVTYVWS